MIDIEKVEELETPESTAKAIFEAPEDFTSYSADVPIIVIIDGKEIRSNRVANIDINIYFPN